MKTKNIDFIEEKYVIIVSDNASGGYFTGDLEKAINIMAEKGWKCVSIYAAGEAMHALMEKL